ncbi:MAG: hypothetical protein GY778_15035, partial [bacterium]|nr:hypothetical protein [bacterium]
MVGGDKVEARTYIQQATLVTTAPEAEPPPDKAPTPGEPPFKGLRYFDVADADWFFGREALTATLVGQLRQYRFLAVVGASGSGKSSLVRAGLIPALQRGETLVDGTRPPQDSPDWPVHVITPTAQPLKELAASLTREAESVRATAVLMDDLAADPRSLDLAVHRLLSQSSVSRSARRLLLLLVDQFEELFTLCRSEEERRAFIDNLLTAAGAPAASEEPGLSESEAGGWGGEGPTIVVLTLRADFYAHCGQYEQLRTLLESRQKYIGPMSQTELRRAIE